MVQVITSRIKCTNHLIERFKREEMLGIAIAVDLLDTASMW
jgi:type I site-specific restriction endonuclease